MVCNSVGIMGGMWRAWPTAYHRKLTERIRRRQEG